MSAPTFRNWQSVQDEVLRRIHAREWKPGELIPNETDLALEFGCARVIANQLEAKGVKLALGASVYDPTDPMGKMFFNILATLAEFKANLIRMRTREGMAIARAKGKLRGKQPKLSEKQQRELTRMHATGEYSVNDLAEVFSVSRPTVYRTLQRQRLVK